MEPVLKDTALFQQNASTKVIITGPNIFFRPLIYTKVNLFSIDNTETGNYKTASKCLRFTD